MLYGVQIYQTIIKRLYVCNKMKDDQYKTKRRLLSEIYIANDYYEDLSRLNWRERISRERSCC